MLDSGTIKGGETNTYSLNLWITDEVNGNYGGQVFSGKLRVEVSQKRSTVSETLFANLPKENINTEDIDQTFIIGENPSNYIWYSGKLWRAVSIDTSNSSVKLVTQWSISSIPYDDDSSNFEGSYMEMWLNDTSVDGFLGNLRNYKNFIITDSKWNVTTMSNANKPPSESEGGVIIEDAVGLLNLYEYTMSYNDTTPSNGYLNNGISSWLITPSSSFQNWYFSNGGNQYFSRVSSNIGIRPSINLKSSIQVASGAGTEEDPYRLVGDSDSNLQGTKLNTRYNGEYINFGTGDNSLYRIVSHEREGLTKITTASPLKENENFKTINFGNNSNYSQTNIIGEFLNENYLINYLTKENIGMIEDNTTWYLGRVEDGNNYRLAKYTDINMNALTTNTTIAKVGLLRLGELMSGQFNSSENNSIYWLITPYDYTYVWYLHNSSVGYHGSNTMNEYTIKPTFNLKANVIITDGNGTKKNPFILKLG